MGNLQQAHHPGSLISGFVDSVVSFPGRPALDVDSAALTYAELWEQASKIAVTLQAVCDPAERFVGFWADRRATSFAAMLGILIAGKAYVPLNPKFPIQRTLEVARLSGCRTVISPQRCAEMAAQVADIIPGITTLLVPDAERATWPAMRDGITSLFRSDLRPAAVPEAPAVAASDPAYLLFTSGSTGTPKGVVINHGNIRAYLDHLRRTYDLTAYDRCSQTAELTFDLHVHEVFFCWDHGACLCVAPGKLALVAAAFVREKELTYWDSVPSVAAGQMRLRLLKPGLFPRVRLTTFGGEAVPAAVVEAWQAAAPGSVIDALYGPTEASVYIAHYRWGAHSAAECVNGVVPIGRMNEGQRGLVVDDQLHPVATGEPGELCLSGSQVAEGYFNDPVRTARSFVRLPHDPEGARWYRTGDLVRQNPDGCFFYLGRIDEQVKVNGYRIELQEIDLILRKALASEDAVAVPWPVNDGMASGIVAVVSGSSPDHDARLIEACRTQLPDYMVPSRVVHLPELPLNVNGKIDRRKIGELLESGY